MRKLHLVGVTTDLKGLIFTARKGSKSGGYLVALDPKLVEAVDDASRRSNGVLPVASGAAQPDKSDKSDKSEKVAAADTGGSGAAAAGAGETGDGRVHSTLSPREMQARMRAGRSIEEVAAEAGVGADWVARFAVPILAEQAQIVALARGLTFAKPRLGPSALALGHAVRRNLVERGLSLPDDLFDPAWSAHQLHDSVWTVRFRHDLRGRAYEAQWELDVPTGRLIARNRVASDLGYVDPGGRRRAAGASGDGALEDDDESSSGAAGPPARPRATGGARRRPASGRVVASKAPSRTRESQGGQKRSTPVAKGGNSGSTRNPPGPSSRASRSPSSTVPVGRDGSTPRAGSKTSASAEKSKGEGGPPVRGGGIRAATAQVASAQVAASRSLVARTVLPAARPAVVRGPGTLGSMASGAGAPGRPATTTPARSDHDGPRPARPRSTGNVDAPERRGPTPADPDRRMPNEASEPDSLIDDLLRDSDGVSGDDGYQGRPGPPARREPSERPRPRRDGGESTAARSGRDSGGRGSDDRHSDRDVEAAGLPRFQPRPGPDGSLTATVTRVRSGGPTGLVRTTSNPTAAGSKAGDEGSGNRSGSRKRADNREPVRVPSVRSPAAGLDRGMPAPRSRSRRLLRRTR